MKHFFPDTGRAILVALGLSLASGAALAAEPDPRLQEVAEDDHRSDANKARNQYRHPVETLTFFGLEDDMTVVELWPGAGWYTEVLAPYLRDGGRYIAAGFEPQAQPGYLNRQTKAFADKMAADPQLYNKVVVTVLAPPAKTEIAPAGSADMVLTFRNLHNWMEDKHLDAVLAAAHRALKPGGILGVVEHRANPDSPVKPQSGYVPEKEAIRLIEAAGFELVEKSEINANPKDTKDYEKGVWTLPPALRLGDKDREKYLAIGESDRMTLKFRKPEQASGEAAHDEHQH